MIWLEKFVITDMGHYMKWYYWLIFICFIFLSGLCLYWWKTKGEKIYWEHIRDRKKKEIDPDINNINEIYLKLSSGSKIGLFEKARIKNGFSASKAVIDEYIEFCNSKKLYISKSEQRLLARIDETEDILDPKKALDKALKKASDEYDDVYRELSESGEILLKTREKSVQLIESVEDLTNSIARHPKEFDKEISEIEYHKTQFKDAKQFGLEQQKALKKSARSVEAGVAAGAAVASMAPTAAMWVATTFGTASTGTAISALSGAAATNAALAWLGGGAISAGGAGVAAGKALLALAGPVGWGIAGGSVLISVILLWRRKLKIDESKKEEIIRMNNCTAVLKGLKAEIDVLIRQTVELEENLDNQYYQCRKFSKADYTKLSNDEKYMLGSLVNNTKSLAVLISKVISEYDN